MENDSISPEPQITLPTIRHDGWTGDKMAIFLETLADTAIVAEACERARMGLSAAPSHPRHCDLWDHSPPRGHRLAHLGATLNG